jgi:uncharacterized protein YjbJ (UPF0337 family)
MSEIIYKIKGNVKRAVGALVGDKRLERAGKVDVAIGRVEAFVEDAKQAARDAFKK